MIMHVLFNQCVEAGARLGSPLRVATGGEASWLGQPSPPLPSL